MMMLVSWLMEFRTQLGFQRNARYCRKIIIFVLLITLQIVRDLQGVFTTTVSCRDFKPVLWTGEELTVRARTYNGRYSDKVKIIANFTVGLQNYTEEQTRRLYEVELRRVAENSTVLDHSVNSTATDHDEFYYDDRKNLSGTILQRQRIPLQNSVSDKNDTKSAPIAMFELVKSGYSYRITVNSSPENESQCLNDGEDGCQHNLLNTGVFHVPDFEAMCKNWIGNILTRPVVRDQKIVITFNISSEYNCCFDDFMVYLFKVTRADCSFNIQRRMTTLVRVERGVISGTIITFSDLESGSYCVHVEPSGNEIGGHFRKLHSREVIQLMPKIVSSAEEPQTIEFSFKQIRRDHWPTFTVSLVILTIILVIFLVIVGVLSWCVFVKRRNPNYRR